MAVILQATRAADRDVQLILDSNESVSARSFERDCGAFAVKPVGVVFAQAPQQHMLFGDPAARADPASAGHRLFDIQSPCMERIDVHIADAAESHRQAICFKIGNIDVSHSRDLQIGEFLDREGILDLRSREAGGEGGPNLFRPASTHLNVELAISNLCLDPGEDIWPGLDDERFALARPDDDFVLDVDGLQRDLIEVAHCDRPGDTIFGVHLSLPLSQCGNPRRLSFGILNHSSSVIDGAPSSALASVGSPNSPTLSK